MLFILYHKFVSFSTIQMPIPWSKDRGIGYFHFLLLKLGYSNKTNNPNASPIKRMFGLFSCGRSDRVQSLCLREYKAFLKLSLAQTPSHHKRFERFIIVKLNEKSPNGIDPFGDFWSPTCNFIRTRNVRKEHGF